MFQSAKLMELKGRREGHPILKGAEERGKLHLVWIQKGLEVFLLQKTVWGHLKSISET